MPDPVHPALEYVAVALRDVLEHDDFSAYLPLAQDVAANYAALEVAAAALLLAYETAPTRPARVVHAEPARPARPHSASDSRRDEDHDRDRRNRPPEPGMALLYVNIGRMDRVRPGDVVGAIAGETGMNGHDIGAISIFEKFTLVEVPEGIADEVIDKMQDATIRGRVVQLRHDRGHTR